MRNMSKATFIAAIAAVAIGSPVLAQSFDPEVGTGNVLPFSYQPTGPATPHAVAGLRNDGKMARRRSGLHAFAMVPGPQLSPNDPALTGGGSIGYNQNMYNY